MKSLFIASGLLAALSGVAAQQLTSFTGFTVELETDYLVNNIEAVTGPFETCLTKCRENAKCQAFTLINESKVSKGCMLKSVALPSNKRVNRGRETYIKVGAPTVNPIAAPPGARLNPVPIGYTAHVGMDYPGPFDLSFNIPHAECAQRCEYMSGCRAFVLDLRTSGTGCWIKSGVSTVSSNSTTEAYVRDVPNPPPMIIPSGYNFIERFNEGTDMYYWLGSMARCEHLCSIVSGCLGWSTITLDGSGCWLKRSGAGTGYRATRDTYWKQNNTATRDYFNGVAIPNYTTREGVDFTAEPTLELAYIPWENCEARCNALRGCKGFVVLKDWTGCFMKGGMTVSNVSPSRDSYVRSVTVSNELDTPTGYAAGISYNFQGNDIGIKRDVPFANCAALCNSETTCIGYVLDRSHATNGCWLKSRFDTGRLNYGRDTYFKINSVPSYTLLPPASHAAIRENSSSNLYRAWHIRYNSVADTAYHQKVTFGVNGYGALEWNLHGFPIGVSLVANITETATEKSCPVKVSVNQFEFRTDGRIDITHPTGTCITGTVQSSQGNWRLEIRKIASTPVRFEAVATNGEASYQLYSTGIPTAPKIHAHALSFGHSGNFDAFPVPVAGAREVRIYALDGLSDSDTDIANSIVGKFNTANPNNYDSTPDDFRHSAHTAQVLKANNYGLVPQSQVTVELVKVSSESGRFLTEQALVNAIKYVVQTPLSTGSKMIVLPVAPDTWGWGVQALCAIEMAYKANVPVFAAAGNDNRTLNTRSPFALTIGAVCGSSNLPYKCSFSNSGSLIDLWASGYFLSGHNGGTSVSAVVVAAIAANMIQRSSTLAANPGLLYNQLMTDAQTLNTFKVASFKSASAIATSAFVRNPIPASACAADATWESLVANAGTAPSMRYVSSEGGQAGCNGWTDEEATGGCE